MSRRPAMFVPRVNLCGEFADDYSARIAAMGKGPRQGFVGDSVLVIVDVWNEGGRKCHSKPSPMDKNSLMLLA